MTVGCGWESSTRAIQGQPDAAWIPGLAPYPAGMRRALLFCPAYPLRDAMHLAATLARAEDLARRLDWQIQAAPHLSSYAAPGTWLEAAVRRQDLMAGRTCEVLIAARGGFGCSAVAATCAALWPPDAAAPGPQLVGYSDVTVLHAVAWRCHWQEGVYGAMPGLAAGGPQPESTVQVAGGAALCADSGRAAGVRAVRGGRAAGRIFPACLRVLCSLVGTPAMPNLAGTILALEDIDERTYRLERDLEQLWHSGALAGVQGLVFGCFPGAEAAPGSAPDRADRCLGRPPGRADRIPRTLRP